MEAKQFVNATKTYQFKARDSEIKYTLCLGDILDILDIYGNLMKGTLYKIMFGLIKNVYGIIY